MTIIQVDPPLVIKKLFAKNKTRNNKTEDGENTSK